MEFTEVIKERYSCKKFDGKAVEKEQLEAILQAGRLAPTAKNLQEQRVYVVQSEEGLAKIDRITPCRYNAGTVLLAAKNAGVESCWLNKFDPEEAAREFGLPENEEVLMLMDLGYPAEGAAPLPPHSSRRELSETVQYL